MWWLEGAQQQRSGLADNQLVKEADYQLPSRSSAHCLPPGCLPSSLGLLLPSALLRCYISFATESLCPRQCCSQRMASEFWQVSKLEGRVMVSIFQQKKLSDKGLLFCPESCPFFFPNFYPLYRNSSNSINQGKKMKWQEDLKFISRAVFAAFPHTVHCPPALIRQKDWQSLEGRPILSGMESFRSERKWYTRPPGGSKELGSWWRWAGRGHLTCLKLTRVHRWMWPALGRADLEHHMLSGISTLRETGLRPIVTWFST